ncbi:MAG: bifunctional pyr operon transcriptional regulator/uracil phosphoribosyltransferase PyrR [Chitinophagaceae bacterium]|nr:bifunctional pyr operon transcriptional regulator/uracil phosphoribosyltransferase PyrR [Chitinophagaceae bacterium]MCW5914368.1 bifunctional pyr operon transcriptional regulator/uracil phosphoribosyltransferase PyrR [Chitinophagaceae bacterium]MCZ2395620.1 bifunctional pyr operon transcriptional regulator/uracil phosphoribosyltransferase PyrR [Chitinophagales bacterium]
MTTILNKEQLQITIRRLACEIAENYFEEKSIAIIGIQPRGIFLADKIVPELQQLLPDTKINYGKLDITFYRDDIRKELHRPNKTDILFSLENSKVVLIDDVLFTGRTIRAAIDAMLSFGRPDRVELCVLINRRYSRQLPIQPDYSGKAIDSVLSQKVKVEWEKDEVNLY